MKQLFPADVESQLEKDYPAESLAEVQRCLSPYQGPERTRVTRCIIHLSAGDATKVSHFVSAAVIDYRDIIYWVEYDPEDRKLRDFNVPFA